MAESRYYNVSWLHLALQDLEHITSYIALDSPANAHKLWQQIRAGVERLAIFPLRCRIVPELKEIGIEAYRELIIDPYRIMIKVQKNAVFILAVFDGRRDLEEVILQRLFV